MNRKLYMAALRVAAKLAEGRNFSPHDLSILRRNALPGESDLPLDLLCCEIIKRELGVKRPRAGPKALR